MAHVSQCSVHTLAIRTTFLGIVFAQLIALLSGYVQAQGAFYQPSNSDFAAPIGTLIREEPRSGAPAAATAHKVLYRSTKPDGTPIAVSGIVVIRRDRRRPKAGLSLLGRIRLQVLCRAVRPRSQSSSSSRLPALGTCSNTDMPLQLRIIRGWARRGHILISWARARLARSSIPYGRHDPFSGPGKLNTVRRVGSLARRSSSTIHRHDRQELRAGITVAGRRSGRAGYRPCQRL